MAEDLRSEYMAVAAAQNARGLQRIKAFQRFFQVRSSVAVARSLLSLSNNHKGSEFKS